MVSSCAVHVQFSIFPQKDKFYYEAVAMVEVEEIELDLGLSIGGTFRKPAEKPKPELGSDAVVSDSDPRDGSIGMQRVDPQPQAKREIQALRRMDAKRKREQKRGTSRDRFGESEPECQRVKTDFLDGVTTVSWTTPFRVQQHATMHYVPLNNGLPLPCWFAGEKNVGGVDGVNGGDGKAKSNGSSRCSSSAVSDYQSSSREDGGSTDSRSHSANSFAEPTQLNYSKEINLRNQPEESASSHPLKSKHGNNNVQDKHNIVKETTQTHQQANIMQQPNPMKHKEEAAAATNSKALPMPNEKPSNGPLKETKVDMGKNPSKLPLLTQTSSLPQMPYVSTKGNGPNGKTVNGFLYRYSKSEVSIVCVCHGSRFSPAEFVQHAGGTDISHPLRHITVIPSAFG